MSVIDLCAFILVLSFLIAVGFYQYRTISSEANYLFANRKCGLVKLTCTLVMTEFNTSTLISFAGMGYLVGKKALSLPFIFLIGLLFYAISVAKKWKDLNASSVVELFHKCYGKGLAKMASFTLIVAMTGFTATYVKSLTLIFSPLFPQINSWFLSAFFVFLTLVMTLRGGLLSIIRTDVATFILLMIFFPLLFYFSYKATPDGIYPIWQEEFSSALPTKFVISLIILTMFTYILAPWYGQKIFSAKSKKIAYQGVFLAAFFVFLLYGMAILSTTTLRLIRPSLLSHEMSLPFLINQLLPSGIKGCSYALLFAIASTTLAGVWSAMSSMAIADFSKKKESNSFSRALLWTLFFSLLSYLLGNTLIDSVFDKLILANIPVAALSFALLAGFYWKKASPFGAYLSIITGLMWGTTCYLYFGEKGLYTWYWTIYGIPLIFISGIIGSYLKPATLKKTEVTL